MCDYAALRSLADGLSVTAFCGHSPPEPAQIRVVASTVAPYLSISLGPPSMYMSRLSFETGAEETFEELCDRTLNPQGKSEYLVALVPVVRESIGNRGHDSHGHKDQADETSVEGMAAMADAIDEPAPVRRRYRIEYALKPGEGGT